MRRKAIIISISGPKLTLKERNLIYRYKPWGIILFKRSMISINQIKKLTFSIRKLMKDKKYPILIDEEGGSVTRTSNLFDNTYSQNFFGKLYESDKNMCLKLYKIYLSSIIQKLKNLGININTVPVLDIIYPKTHKVIGNRSFSNKINTIKELGLICTQFYKKNKISTVIKHIPGHGRALKDSHQKLPIVKTSYRVLKKMILVFLKI